MEFVSDAEFCEYEPGEPAKTSVTEGARKRVELTSRADRLAQQEKGEGLALRPKGKGKQKEKSGSRAETAAKELTQKDGKGKGTGAGKPYPWWRRGAQKPKVGGAGKGRAGK